MWRMSKGMRSRRVRGSPLEPTDATDGRRRIGLGPPLSFGGSIMGGRVPLCPWTGCVNDG